LQILDLILPAMFTGIYAFISRQCRQMHYVFGLSVHNIRSSGQTLLP